MLLEQPHHNWAVHETWPILMCRHHAGSYTQRQNAIRVTQDTKIMQ